ncbi:hypothetical protein FSARC_2189 [Fusarium sarcochroum]|uniref:Uncharacterized protein n=1 Tax=Fusarium sarcochroum TaxID=1208366 RepID=A0A8H4U799_9HYPO|nr:hypothetical protein FSARC_2189 [Fusarium sarcochroum]
MSSDSSARIAVEFENRLADAHNSSQVKDIVNSSMEMRDHYQTNEASIIQHYLTRCLGSEGLHDLVACTYLSQILRPVKTRKVFVPQNSIELEQNIMSWRRKELLSPYFNNMPPDTTVVGMFFIFLNVEEEAALLEGCPPPEHQRRYAVQLKLFGIGFSAEELLRSGFIKAIPGDILEAFVVYKGLDGSGHGEVPKLIYKVIMVFET